MKTLETLIDDIYSVVKGVGGWDRAATEFLSTSIASLAEQRFGSKQEPRRHLSLSAIGTPCKRKLWYKINQPDAGEELSAESLGTFFYGDLLEALVLALAKAAGHDVQGEQDRLHVHGIKGHRDAIIDGVTVDIKSASKFGYEKFKNHSLREDDPFGYISQLSSYVYAGRDDPLVRNKHEGAFLVVQKDRFKLCLDRYDFTEELKHKEREIAETKKLVEGPMPEERLDPVPQSSKSENTKLSISCNYCEYRKICWPEARTFLYSTGPVHLVDVVSEPRAVELIE